MSRMMRTIAVNGSFAVNYVCGMLPLRYDRIISISLGAVIGMFLVVSGGEAAAVSNYQSAVPEYLRSLISEADYSATLGRLDAAAQELSEKQRAEIAASPCAASISNLVTRSIMDKQVRDALQMALDGMKDPPPSAKTMNPWKEPKTVHDLVLKLRAYAIDWCVALPQINGNDDDGLKYISPMYWFSYHNPAGKYFVQGLDPLPPHNPLSLNFFKDFSVETGAFMNTKASTANVMQWVKDPRIEIKDYKTKEYASWNDFFTREITVDTLNKTIPSRPATMPQDQYPERDYIIVSPTDCIMNPVIQVFEEKGEKRQYIDNPLQLDTVLDIKNIPISVNRLLGSAPQDIKNAFQGGTGLSCILMPNTYHHFHAPVNGTVVHAEVVKGPTFGYDDWANLMPSNHNPAQPGTDFSEFEVYQRGVVIIKVTYKDTDGKSLTGYVASIPVGLDTIGSVVLDKEIKSGATVTRGYTRIGNFLYGGSMDLLLFSKGLATGSIQTRMGNQIGIINAGKLPQSK